jgi:hypothetical protein
MEKRYWILGDFMRERRFMEGIRCCLWRRLFGRFTARDSQLAPQTPDLLDRGFEASQLYNLAAGLLSLLLHACLA